MSDLRADLRAMAPALAEAIDELGVFGVARQLGALVDAGGDGAEIEAHRDNRRIFQALCTERDRLMSLSPGWEAAEAINHTNRLIDAFAARVNANRVNDSCPCIRLSSGKVHPCSEHAGSVRDAGRMVDTHHRPDRSALVSEIGGGR